jgi:hypothetical protein
MSKKKNPLNYLTNSGDFSISLLQNIKHELAIPYQDPDRVVVAA